MSSGDTQIHGFLNFYKPPVLTSMEVVRRIKRLTKQRVIGHGGTLDPLAEGILPILLGQATRLMENLVESPKLYRMDIRLGLSTDTYDAQGKVLSESNVSHITVDQVEQNLEHFRGIFHQVPPMYSALKYQGKRFYQLARAGVEIKRDPRQVQIYRLDLVEWAPPIVTLEAECGRGVYMRSLAHDMGEALGCGAHLSALARLKVGRFNQNAAITMQRFEEACDSKSWPEFVEPPDSVLLSMKGVTVNRATERLIRLGQSVNLGARFVYAAHLESYRAYNTEGCFLAILRYNKGFGIWRPYKVFNLLTPSPHAPQQDGQ